MLFADMAYIRQPKERRPIAQTTYASIFGILKLTRGPQNRNHSSLKTMFDRIVSRLLLLGKPLGEYGVCLHDSSCVNNRDLAVTWECSLVGIIFKDLGLASNLTYCQGFQKLTLILAFCAVLNRGK